MINTKAHRPSFHSTQRIQNSSIHGVVHKHKIQSDVLGREVEVYVRQPDNFDPSKGYGAMIGPDGHRTIDQERSFRSDFPAIEWNTDAAQQEMVRQGKAKPTYQVWIDGEHQRFDELIPFPTKDVPGGKGGDSSAPLFRFIKQELMPALAEKTNIIMSREYLAFAGTSLGGVAANHAGTIASELFGTVWVGSPSVQLGDTSRPEGQQDEAMTRSLLENGKLETNFFTTEGSKEGYRRGEMVDERGARGLVNAEGRLLTLEEINEGVDEAFLQPWDQVSQKPNGVSDQVDRWNTFRAAATAMGMPAARALLIEGAGHTEGDWRQQFPMITMAITQGMEPVPMSDLQRNQDGYLMLK